jgi:hypothetical protein
MHLYVQYIERCEGVKSLQDYEAPLLCEDVVAVDQVVYQPGPYSSLNKAPPARSHLIYLYYPVISHVLLFFLTSYSLYVDRLFLGVTLPVFYFVKSSMWLDQ